MDHLKPDTGYLLSLKAEVRLLIRTIAGDPDKSLSTIAIDWQEASGPVRLDYATIVQLISQIPPATEPELLTLIGKLQIIRDELTTAVKPATGLSIAYTALVAGDQRRTGTQSAYGLAQEAFAGLEGPAQRHRVSIKLLSILAILLVFFASWEATKASLGKSLLQTLEPLRTQQAAITAEKLKLEMRIDTAAATPGTTADPLARAALHLPLCDRHMLFADATMPATKTDLRPHATAEIRDVCERDRLLALNFKLAQDELRRFNESWPDLVGGLFKPVSRWAGHVVALVDIGLEQVLPASRFTEPPACPGCNDPIRSEDIEFRIAPIIQVIISYILPFTLGIVGSLLFVVLDHYTRMRANQLVPRDLALSHLRVILGIVVAVCISLLITGAVGPAVPIQGLPSGSAAPSSLVGSLTLSASLIAFLAGFGAEAVFSLLQTLVQRVFASPK